MGKDRSKDNSLSRGKTKPSSSAEAAALLGISGQLATGFIGFGTNNNNLTVINTGSNNAAAGGLAGTLEVETSLDPEYQLAFKALSKRDPITKLKAFQELSILFKGVTDENVTPVLKIWTQAYNRLGFDDDRRVREGCNQAFIILVRSVKKNLAPYLKSLIGVWLLNLFDPYKEVCIAARNALNAAIPVAKQTEAISFCRKEILSFIKDNLELPPPSTDSVVDHERYERIISGITLSLSFIIETLSEKDNDALFEEYQGIFHAKFWALFTSKSALVRKSVYHTMTVLCSKLPRTLEISLEKLSPLVAGVFTDKEALTHASMWECVLSFMKKFPKLWTFVKVKSVFPKLWAFLRSGCYGSASISYPSLLPLVNFIPLDVVGDPADFYKEFLTSLWKGLQSDYMSKGSREGLHLIKAYLECVKFFIGQSRAANSANQEYQLVDVHFMVVIEHFLIAEPLQCPPEDLVKLIMETLHKISLSSDDTIMGPFWGAIRTLVLSSLDSNTVNSVLCQRLYVIFSHASSMEESKVVAPINELAKSVFIVSVTRGRMQRIPLLVQLATRLAQTVDIAGLLGNSQISYRSFFEQNLMDWVLEWIQLPISSDLPLSDLFSLVCIYLSSSPDRAIEWDSVIKVITSRPNRLELLYLLLEQACSRGGPQQWRTEKLDEIAVHLSVIVSTEEIIDQLIYSRKLLCLLVGGNGESFVSEATLLHVVSQVTQQWTATLHTSFSNASDKSFLQTNRTVALLRVMDSLLKLQSWPSSSALTRQSIISIVFDSRINTKFYYERFLIKGDHIHRSSDEDDTLSPEMIIQFSPIASTARDIWASSKTVIMAQLVEHKQTSLSALIDTILDRVFATIDDESLGLALLEDQVRELVYIFGSDALSVILSSTRMQSSLLPQIDQHVSAVLLDYFEPSSSRLICEAQGEQALFQLLKKGYLVSSVFAINNRVSVANHYILELVYSMTLKGKLELDLQSFSEQVWVLCTSAIQSMLPSCLKNLSDTDLHSVVMESLRLSFQHTGIYSLALDKLLSFIDCSELDVLALAKFQENLSDQVVRTWQIVAPRMILTAPSEQVTEIRGRLLQRINTLSDSVFLARCIESILAFYPEQKILTEDAPYFVKFLEGSWDKSSLQLNTAFAKLFTSLVASVDLTAVQFRCLFGQAVLWVKLLHTPYEDTFTYRTLKLLETLCRKFHAISSDELRWSDYLSDLMGPILLIVLQRNQVTSPQIVKILAGLLVHVPVHISSNFVGKCIPLLHFNNVDIQLGAYELLARLVTQKKGFGMIVDADNPGQSIPPELRVLFEDVKFQQFANDASIHCQLGYMLAWLLMLHYLDSADSSQRLDVSTYVRKSKIGSICLSQLVPFLDTAKFEWVDAVNLRLVIESLPTSLRTLSRNLFYNTVRLLPIVFRTWFTEDLDRRASFAMEKFVVKHLTPRIIDYEVSNILQAKLDYENFRIKPNRAAREVSATYEKDEISLTIVIRFGESFPLRLVEVEAPARSGVSEPLWRKWLLSMNALLLTQDYSILDAILMFKSNLDKHFSGVDVCPICYSLLHNTMKTLPGLSCKTCKNKFHSQCIYNWISVSHKNDCPLCRSPIY